MLTYYNGDFGVSLRYPPGWKTDQAEQDGVFYRYFLAPPAGPERKPAVSATLLAGPLTGSLEDYAGTYLSGHTLATSKDDSRPGAIGRSYAFASPDGSQRFALLLLQEGDRVFGLYAQGEAAHFEHHWRTLEEMARSLTLERTQTYPERRDPALGLAFRLPPSWRETRTFSAGGTHLMQYASPPLASERGGETVHASLGVSVEKLSPGAGLGEFYASARQKQGESYQVLSHQAWRDGWADVTRSETSLTVSRVKRFYRAAGGRGYLLSCEARDDVFSRVSRWCDLIAGTLKVGGEVAP
jgi:hypothetical protein